MEKEIINADFLICFYNGNLAVCLNRDRANKEYDVAAVKKAFNELHRVAWQYISGDNESLIRINAGEFLDYQGHCFISHSPSSRIYVPSSHHMRCSCLVSRLDNLVKHVWQQRLQSRSFHIMEYDRWLSSDRSDFKPKTKKWTFDFVGIEEFEKNFEECRTKYANAGYLRARLAFWRTGQAQPGDSRGRFTFDLKNADATVYDAQSNEIVRVTGDGSDILAGKICDFFNQEFRTSPAPSCLNEASLPLPDGYRPVRQGDVIDMNALKLKKSCDKYCGFSCPVEKNLSFYVGQSFIWFSTMDQDYHFFVPKSA